MPKRELCSPSLPPAFHKSGTPPALGEGQAGSLLAGMPVWEAGRTVRKLNMDRGGVKQEPGAHREGTRETHTPQFPPHSGFPPSLTLASLLPLLYPPSQPHSPPHHLPLLLSGPL